MAGRGPRTVFVAGARRDAGKTTVCELLLRSLPGAGAIKVTCCRPEMPCPREKSCGVCAALSAPFAVIDDAQVLATPGKDTARLRAAASGETVWLQVREEALTEGMEAALGRFGGEAVVVEGNAAFQAMAPDVGVLVVGGGEEPAKPSVGVALPHVHGVVLNRRPGAAEPAMVAGTPEGCEVFRFDALRPDEGEDGARFLRWVSEALAAPG